MFQVIGWVIFNQLVVGLPMASLSFNLFKYRGIPDVRELPTFHWVLFELAIHIILEEIGFYYSHRYVCKMLWLSGCCFFVFFGVAIIWLPVWLRGNNLVKLYQGGIKIYQIYLDVYKLKLVNCKVMSFWLKIYLLFLVHIFC